MHAALAFLLAGLLIGMALCGAIWAAGERAERRERIERARRRDHSKVPSIRDAAAGAFDRAQERVFVHFFGPL